MADGRIVAEKKLSKYEAKLDQVKRREEIVMKWLVENGL